MIIYFIQTADAGQLLKTEGWQTPHHTLLIPTGANSKAIFLGREHWASGLCSSPSAGCSPSAKEITAFWAHSYFILDWFKKIINSNSTVHTVLTNCWVKSISDPMQLRRQSTAGSHCPLETHRANKCECARSFCTPPKPAALRDGRLCIQVEKKKMRSSQHTHTHSRSQNLEVNTQHMRPIQL